jgi:hypothetical protein
VILIIHRDIEQGSDAWHSLRLGIPTASRFGDVLAKGKGLTRKAYMRQLANELFTGYKGRDYINSSMEWGIETESQARDTYARISGNNVDQVTFITHKTIKAGYSPDGLVGSDGALEIKCPNSTTHIKTVQERKTPSKHTPQIQGGLWLSEREWMDFVSFDPRCHSQEDYLCIRIYRDEGYIKHLKSELLRFNDELDNIMAQFTESL